ncbi:MAG: tRNA pseudouridine(38-40) synthase TruA [Myxococcota bacterium]
MAARPASEGHAATADETRRTVLLTVAYDGAAYAGFARQDNATTVAEMLLRAIARFDPSVSELRVASRTDAGVHARCNQVAFDTTRDLPPQAWVRGMMPLLPDDVAVRAAAAVPQGFTPRFASRGKRYRYVILVDRCPDPQWTKRAWRIWGLDEEAAALMSAELSVVAGTHDFSAFASSRDPRRHRRRTLTRPVVRWVDVAAGGPGSAPRVTVDIAGDGFLHHMVRILVGTAVDVGLGRRPPGTMATALAGRDRRRAGQTAPPYGLYLDDITLAVQPFAQWPEARPTRGREGHGTPPSIVVPGPSPASPSPLVRAPRTPPRPPPES